MKLLFDQNLSSFLVPALADLFPGSAHVRELAGLEASDAEIWAIALAQDFAIVTKHQDFNDRTGVESISPKIIWIRLGNCPTTHIERLIRWRFRQIADFGFQNIDSVLGLP
jgi:predicted nuclease of predicted toxin-antitoxin system